MQIIDAQLTTTVPAVALWQVWSDVDQWPTWDPHEKDARLLTTFEAGGRGYSAPHGAPAGEFELIEVDAPRRWVSHAPLPSGALTFTHSISEADAGERVVRIECTASGPLAWIVQLGWGRAMRRDAPRTLAALTARAQEVATR